jgi:hypothetical protein
MSKQKEGEVELEEPAVPTVTSALGLDEGVGVVIGVTGRAGHGKDTVADYLKSLDFQVLHYAGPLKHGVSALFDIPLEWLYDASLKEKVVPEWGRSPRQLMQWLGTDVMREQVNEHFWLWHMRKRLLAMPSGTRVVVADCRFDNEAALLKKDFGAQIWRVDASRRLEPGGGPLQGETAGHVTEKGVDDRLVDVHLDNNGTRDALLAQVDQALLGVLEPYP